MKKAASLLLAGCLAVAPGAARKIWLKLKAGNKKADTEQTMKHDMGPAMMRGSFMVESL